MDNAEEGPLIGFGLVLVSSEWSRQKLESALCIAFMVSFSPFVRHGAVAVGHLQFYKQQRVKDMVQLESPHHFEE